MKIVQPRKSERKFTRRTNCIEEAANEKEEECEDATALNKKKKKMKTALRGIKYSRTSCEAVF